jgi:hypothetical protein
MGVSDQRDLFGNLPYGGEPPSQRHSDTSRAAAAQIKKRIGPLHHQLIAFLHNVGGATDEEMQTGIPMAANTQRPRRCELQAIDRIEDSGMRRLTRSRREAVVWRLVQRRL